MQSTSERLGVYELIGRIAAGGMAEVFLARRTGAMGFEKVFVVKRILPHLANETEFVTMFLDEARIAARINHPNVVQIIDLGQEGTSYFIVMEYLQGQSLSAILKFAYRKKMHPPAPIVARILADACAGLHAAHELRDAKGEHVGLVHRDVSPQNIVTLYNGGVKLVDFGVAKAKGRLTRTSSRALKGKYSYMSPEQALGGPLDRRSDVFSMGIVLWECLAMRRLYQSESELAILRDITEAPPTSPSEFRDDVPPGLEAIALRALSKDREDRFATAEAMKREIEACLRTLPTAAGTSEIADYMVTLFPNEIQRGQEVLLAAARGDIPTAAADQAMLFAQLRHDASVPETGPSGAKNVFPGTRPALAPVAQSGTGDLGLTAGGDEETISSGTLDLVARAAGAEAGAAKSSATADAGGFDTGSELSRARGEVLLPETVRPGGRIRTIVAICALLAAGGFAGWWFTAGGSDDPDRKHAARGSPDEQDGERSDVDEDDDDDDTTDGTGDTDEGDTATADPGTGPGGTGDSATGTPESASADAATAAPGVASAVVETAKSTPDIGYLNLETNPWTTVYLGRKKLGTTPLVKARLPPGSHKLKLVNEKAGIRVTKVVKIKRGKITRVRWRL